jgi:hypothetical protein
MISYDRIRTLVEDGSVRATKKLAIETRISLSDADDCMIMDTVEESIYYLESIGVEIEHTGGLCDSI